MSAFSSKRPYLPLAFLIGFVFSVLDRSCSCLRNRSLNHASKVTDSGVI
jgi:hypothetical protein